MRHNMKSGQSSVTFYHYCSTEAFRSILVNKSIWLSSLISSNDALEGHWMTRIINLVSAEEALKESAILELDKMARMIEGITDCLGFCLSEDGDTLSQWRGYADDGRGVSIGFNTGFLEELAQTAKAVTFQKVEYNVDAQKARVRQLVPRMKVLIDRGACDPPLPGGLLTQKTPQEYSAEVEEHIAVNNQLFNLLLELSYSWFAFKNPAFREENEWRLAMTVLAEHQTEYRTAAGRLVPYKPISFPPRGDLPAIDEVVLGPKHTTPVRIVESFLRRCGHSGAKVRLSDASYR
ncbi:DUF2971 domain-containing protein [Rhizobium rosettiformans]|uniref:DUF2971 domain-containing protein n=1 Tax=Rhizobium rosettiformans TaxID=1368430 RepID=UPI002867697C|nr:DUF2971 domain-containing protein [Rhizobium rosettiformans]MDR7029822.1 hypothetical protein [Rhizobium rosettiformans]MDR7063536.1 hypothetical protein [Rhizobium rosettiformans]